MVKALVVDDEALLRELFEQMLESQGYDVAVASNGEEALDLLKADQFEVVLLDLMLGPVSGFTVLEEIHQMYYPPVILVMTGYGSTDVAIQAMKSGAADFIMKPVDPDVLDIRIRKALDERRAQRLAITDGLTSLYNRRYFEERLEEETRRARRYSRPMSIMMLDIDFFKQFNDNNGHLKGDQVLREIAQVLLRFSRETDIVARYGGEEFVMILPETDAHNSGLLAERIRISVDETIFEGQENIPSGNVTLSIGVSCLAGDEGGHDTLERADQALYKSKQNGRNQTTILE
ncbi:MAG: diguanylate cyclase [Candidatus Latescibacteria bacterium]|nr:diguanylate cyclase [Candidatus Latescibacterota bacterium]